CTWPAPARPRRSWSSIRSCFPAGCDRTACACRRSSLSRRRPFPRRLAREDYRSHTRGAWPGRRPPTVLFAQRLDCAGKTHWILRRWKNRRTGGWSTAWWCTSSNRGPAKTARDPGTYLGRRDRPGRQRYTGRRCRCLPGRAKTGLGWARAPRKNPRTGSPTVVRRMIRGWSCLRLQLVAGAVEEGKDVGAHVYGGVDVQLLGSAGKQDAGGVGLAQRRDYFW